MATAIGARLNFVLFNLPPSMTRLSSGLAIKGGARARKLQMLAALMEKDLFGGFLWTEIRSRRLDLVSL